MKGKFLLTINDDPVIRELFDGFNIREQEVKYCLDVANNNQKARELYIMNYDSDAQR